MKILVLAGGYDQKDLILELKKKQHQVILADYLDNPPARETADSFFQISTLDVEAVLKLARKEKVDMVTTACTDQALLTTAWVSNELGLPSYLSYDQACRVTNKALMKSKLVRNSIPTAPYRILAGVDDLAMDLPFPRVVKPVDCNSSKGVRKVEKSEEMEAAVAEAIRESRTGTALVESFIPGAEVSVDVYVQGGQAVVLMVSETLKIPDTDGFTIVQSRVPAGLSRQGRSAIRKICQQIADAFALDETPLLVQCVVQDDRPFVLEFSARLGGGTKHRLIEAVTGVDMISVFTERILGEKPRIAPQSRVPAATLTYCYGKPGPFSHLENADKLMAEGIISACFQYKTSGMVVNQARTSGDRVCGFLVTGADDREVAHKEEQAGRDLIIRSMDGVDLFRRELLPKVR